MNIHSLRALELEPISDRVIWQSVPTNIIDYPNLKNYHNLDQLFNDDSCVIFYPHTAGPVGHWTCLTRRGDTVEYFDSYGNIPDHFLKESPPYLSQLLIQSPYQLLYNEDCFQGKGTATCGRHVITRILFRKYPLSFYQKMLEYIYDDDLFVTLVSDLKKNNLI
jgi:hypothetical protein